VEEGGGWRVEGEVMRVEGEVEEGGGWKVEGEVMREEGEAEEGEGWRVEGEVKEGLFRFFISLSLIYLF
jgi:hypothetical protein